MGLPAKPSKGDGFYEVRAKFCGDLGRARPGSARKIDFGSSEGPPDEKKIEVGYGSIEIAKTHPFSRSVHGFAISPSVLERMIYVGQLETYGKGAEVLVKLGGIRTNDAQLHRVTDYFGGLLTPHEAGKPDKSAVVGADEVVYGAVDGSMILTDDGWKEVKLGRVFREGTCSKSLSPKRNGRIGESQYAAVLGSHTAFAESFEPLLAPYAHLGGRLVFLTDGALWIKNWMDANYPKAVQILDFYHVKEHLGQFAKLVMANPKERTDWVEQQADHLKNGAFDSVVAAIRTFDEQNGEQAKLLNYLESNRDRMDYRLFLEAGLFIGSGAIEAAHKTVIQCRLKKSGQRWSDNGAQNLLNLRVAYMSGQSHKIINLFQKPRALAA